MEVIILYLLVLCHYETMAMVNIMSYGDNDNLMASTFQLGELLKEEMKFVRELKSYVEIVKQEAHYLEAHLKAYYENWDFEKIQDVDAHIAHPINALTILKRTSALGDYFQSKDIEAKKEQLRNLTKHFPSHEHYFTACGSIALIQESYGQPTDDVATGVLTFRNISYPATNKLDILDMVNIGLGAANRFWYDTSVEWLKKAVDMIDNSTQEQVAETARVQLEEVISVHDQVLDQKGPVSENHRTFSIPFDAKLRKKKKYKEAKKRKTKHVEKQQKLMPIFKLPSNAERLRADYQWNFMSLCREGSSRWREPIHDLKLMCQLQHHGDPYLRVGPFKMEELNEEPYIISLPDFVSEKIISEIKSLAANRLEMSQVSEAQMTNTFLRTSKQAWIADKFFIQANETKVSLASKKKMYHLVTPESIYNERVIKDDSYKLVTSTLNSRISLASQLMTQGPYSSEQYQVANYGLGGQYGLHFDPFFKYDKHSTEADETGDRFATFMIYLSDVEAGGDTAFPMIGLSSKAQKGTAILWINNKPSGLPDKLTGHGGCPVLVGSKWIANKWILDNDQLMKFPCALLPEGSRGMLDMFRNQNLSLTNFKVWLD